MATVRGCSGKVKVDTLGGGSPADLGELTNWSFEETSEQIDVSEMGACVKKFDAGAKATTGEITAWWDPADLPQQDVIVGNAIELEIYPDGDASGKTYYEAPAAGATITSQSFEGGGVDGTVGITIGFSVNGGMTKSTVP